MVMGPYDPWKVLLLKPLGKSAQTSGEYVGRKRGATPLLPALLYAGAAYELGSLEYTN